MAEPPAAAHRRRAAIEARQQGDQLLQFCHIFRRGQQEQNGVKVAFFRYHAVFTQEVGENGGRYAEGVIFAAGGIDPRGGQQKFARIDKVLMLGITVKGVPAFAWAKLEEAQVNGDLRGFI